MKNLVVMAWLVGGLLAFSALPAGAQQFPECDDSPGACFQDAGPQNFFLRDGDGDRLFASFGGDSPTDFLRQNPDGRLFLQIGDLDVGVFACRVGPLVDCPTGLLSGPGRIQSNVSAITDGMGNVVDLTCPSTINVTADLADPETGEQFYMVGKLTLLGGNSGTCGIAVIDIRFQQQ